MKRIMFFRDPGAGGSGGGLGPSISDLVGVGSTGSTEPITKLDEVIQQTDEGLNPDGTLKEGYTKNADGTVTKTEPTPAPVEGVNEDGTLQEGYVKDDQGNVVKDPNYKPAEEVEEDEADYYEEVEKITGRKVAVQFPEGMDASSPEARQWLTTPEGTAAVLNAEREAGGIAFEQYLQQSNPRAYAFMLHLEAGGSEADFFNDNRGYALPTQEEMSASADAQAAVYKYDLLAKGNSEEEAQALVDLAIKNNKLKERSDNSWKAIDKAQKDQLAALQQQKDNDNKAFETAVATITAQVQEQIKAGIGFIVPEAQQGEFQRYVMDNLRYDNGQFYVVQEVGKDQKTLLESLFFQFKKGDLKQLVARQAKTEAAHRLRLKTGNGKTGPGTGGEASRSQTSHIPLSQILPS